MEFAGGTTPEPLVAQPKTASPSEAKDPAIAKPRPQLRPVTNTCCIVRGTCGDLDL